MTSKRLGSITIPSAFYVEYREGDHVMKIDMDMRDTVPVLSHKAIHSWEAPHTMELISEEKKKQIMQELVDYLVERREFKFEVRGGSLFPSCEFK